MLRCSKPGVNQRICRNPPLRFFVSGSNRVFACRSLEEPITQSRPESIRIQGGPGIARNPTQMFIGRP